MKAGATGKTCVADPTCSLNVTTSLPGTYLLSSSPPPSPPQPTPLPSSPGCEVCANNTALPWDCKTCCDGCTAVKYGEGTFCKCSAPGPGPAPGPAPGPTPRGDYGIPYANTHFRKGQTNALCPTGVQFETLWDGGAGAGFGAGATPPPGGHGGKGFGTFAFTMVDKLKVPNVPAGEYALSWRW
jgi:hypothetical protein